MTNRHLRIAFTLFCFSSASFAQVTTPPATFNSTIIASPVFSNSGTTILPFNVVTNSGTLDFWSLACAPGCAVSPSAVNPAGTNIFGIASGPDSAAWITSTLSAGDNDSKGSLSASFVRGLNTTTNNHDREAGDPISTATGELFDPAIPPDLFLGGPLPLQFRRYYASLITAGGVVTRMGNNWAHNFEWLLTLNGSFAEVSTPDEKVVLFQQSASGAWQLALAEAYGYQFAALPNNTYQFLDPRSNLIYTFSGTGSTLGNTSIQDRNGNTLTIALPSNGSSQVSDGLGRSLTITYNSAGQLVGVADQTGRTVSFGFTGDNLTQFTDANGKVETYAYAASAPFAGLMTSDTLPLGNAPFTQTWDAVGRVATQADSRGNTMALTYDQPVGSTVVKDAAGAVMTDTSLNYSNFLSYTDPDKQTLSVTYDANGHRNSLTDRMGNKIAMTFHSPSGYLASVTDALGNTTTNTWLAQVAGPFTFYVLAKVQYADGTAVSFTYDASGNVLTATDQAGKVSRNTYNSRGQVLTSTDPVGRVTTFAYNSADATLASSTDAAGNTTTYSYDPQKRVSQIKFADGTTRSFTYDGLDHVLTTVNELAKTTAFAFNANEKLQTATDALGKSTALAYTADEKVAKTTDRTGQSASYAYNQVDLNSSVTTPAGETFTFAYDTHQRESAALDPSGKGFSFTYDKEDALASVTDGLSRKTAFTTDPIGRTTSVTTPLGESYLTAFDKFSRVTSSTDPSGIAATATYDPRGLVTGIAIGGSSLSLAAALAHDDSGLLTGITDPNGSAWSFGYDAAGRLASRTDPLKRPTSYFYDNRNRVTGVQTPVGTLASSYDPAGNLLNRTYSDGTKLSYTYDSDNRLLTASGVTLSYDAEDRLTGSNGLAITRDADGRISTITYAAGKTVTYAYNANGLLASVTDWVGGATTFTYDAAHELTAIKRPNGLTTQFTYDGDGRIASITESAGSSIAITRDAAGKVVSESRTQPQAPAIAPGVLPLNYDAADQVAGYTYDGMGRVIADSLRSYTWDLASRMTSYTGANASYDAFGMRTSLSASGSTQAFVWNYATGLPTLATVQSATPGSNIDLRYYVYLPGGGLLYAIDAATNARHYYHFDETGSTVLLTNDAGAVTDSYGTTAYGETVTQNGTTSNPFTWLGQFGVMQEGSTGLYYMRSRYYDSTTARFLSPDPVLSANPLQVNPYLYALANPIGLVDPAGTDPDATEGTRLAMQLSDLPLGVTLYTPPVIFLYRQRLLAPIDAIKLPDVSLAPQNAASASIIPSFSSTATSIVTTNTLTFSSSTTNLFFPFVPNANGFETGSAIANTSKDPFGTAAQSGTCSLNFYGSGAPSPSNVVNPTVPTGAVYAQALSGIAAGFQGYLIASCQFQYAHGFAFITDGGANAGLQGYLSGVIPQVTARPYPGRIGGYWGGVAQFADELLKEFKH